MAIGIVKITATTQFEYETDEVCSDKDAFIEEAIKSMNFGDLDLDKAEVVGELNLDEQEEEETTP